MKKNILIILAFFTVQILNAQTLTENKIGKAFFLSTPDYMTRVFGLNDIADYSAGNHELGVFAMIIQEEKANIIGNEIDLATKDKYYASAYETLKETGKILSESAPKNIKIGTFDAKQLEITVELQNEESGTLNIFYLITIIETPEYLYKIYTWTTEADKAKYINDFKKISNSFRE